MTKNLLQKKMPYVEIVAEAWDKGAYSHGRFSPWNDLDAKSQNAVLDFVHAIADESEQSAQQRIKFDPVQKAKHYNLHPSGIECIDVIRHYNYCIGSAMKYLWRNGLKEEADMQPIDKQIQDLEKAVYCIEDEIEWLKGTRK